MCELCGRRDGVKWGIESEAHHAHIFSFCDVCNICDYMMMMMMYLYVTCYSSASSKLNIITMIVIINPAFVIVILVAHSSLRSHCHRLYTHAHSLYCDYTHFPYVLFVCSSSVFMPGCMFTRIKREKRVLSVCSAQRRKRENKWNETQTGQGSIQKGKSRVDDIHKKGK